MLMPALLPALLLAGCAASGGDWPSLNPRPGEAAPMVPRPALGCRGCGTDVVTPAATVAAVPAPPADAAARLGAIEAAIAAVEAEMPARQRAVAAAEAAARGSRDDSDAAATAESERSRYAILFVPLAGAARQLDDLEDDLAGSTGETANAPAIAALRARLAALEAARTP
jgi:hypothetical protein